MSWFSLFFIEFHRINWPAGTPEVNQILWEGQKHRMLLRITEDFTVCLYTFFPQCKCWEGFLTDADPVDKGEEPAFCWSLKGIIFVQYNFKDTSCKGLSCLFVKQQKTAGKDQGPYSWKILVLRVAPSNKILRKFLEMWMFPLKFKEKILVKKKVIQKAS